MQLLLKSPVLLEEELSAITSSSGLSTQTFRLRYTAGHADALATALKGLCSDVEAAVKAGCEVLVLSDRLPEGEEVGPPPPPPPTPPLSHQNPFWAILPHIPFRVCAR